MAEITVDVSTARVLQWLRKPRCFAGSLALDLAELRKEIAKHEQASGFTADDVKVAGGDGYPGDAAHFVVLGIACFERRLFMQALGAFEEALRRDVTSAAAFIETGILANFLGLPELGVRFFRRSLELRRSPAAHNGLGSALLDQGFARKAVSHFRRAVELRPDDLRLRTGYLFALNNLLIDVEQISAEHRHYGAIAERQPLREQPRRTPGDRLRVGYLSADFRGHSVGSFFLPLIASHTSRIQTTCYSLGAIVDETTHQIARAANRFRPVRELSDDELAAQIAADQIDVLVDLNGHTADNRLPMLARRVAPVQMTYLGYPNTTGLAQMDFRISDDVADPPGMTDHLHTEQVLRVPGGFLAWRRPAYDVEPAASTPVRANGYITFCSFNNLAKITDEVLATWASVLGSVPNSCLLIKARGLSSKAARERIADAFEADGVCADRIEMHKQTVTTREHLELYRRADVALGGHEGAHRVRARRPRRGAVCEL